MCFIKKRRKVSYLVFRCVSLYSNLTQILRGGAVLSCSV